MPRPRKPAVSAAYRRRNERARSLGYRDYYDYRLHDSGRLPPGPLELTPEERARRRGHRGTADFLRSLGEGDLIIMPMGLSSIVFDEHARRGVGAFEEIVKTVIYAASGRERTFALRNLARNELIDTILEEQRRGAIFSPSPSLDQRRLVSPAELKPAKRKPRTKR